MEGDGDVSDASDEGGGGGTGEEGGEAAGEDEAGEATARGGSSKGGDEGGSGGAWGNDIFGIGASSSDESVKTLAPVMKQRPLYANLHLNADE